ncbi:MAG: hypothetical protein ACP5T6_02315, partial [Candidatus Micrarchaeia archaeon]
FMKDFNSLREEMLKRAKEGISSSYESEEYALIQSINAYNETTKSFNLAQERLNEWFGLYFPELKINSPQTLVQLINTLFNNYSYESILKIVNNESTAKIIYEKARSTIGRKANEDEIEAIKKFASLSEYFNETLIALDKYIKKVANSLMPNTVYITDAQIAAELLSKAGSLERLALMPAGTIQLLGAERALFKHIKYGSKPPKYGILFNLSDIGTAPKELKGPIARVYATKISIALKADYYTKKFIAKELKENIIKSIEYLKKKPRKEKKIDNKNNYKNDRNNKNYNKDRNYNNKNYSKGYNRNNNERNNKYKNNKKYHIR